MALRNLFEREWCLAVLGGVLLAAAYPKIGIPGFAWIAPGLILATALGESSGKAFRLGYVFGLSHYLISLYWLIFMPFPMGAIGAWLALSAYLALFPAIWLWLCVRLLPDWTRAFEIGGSGRWRVFERYLSIPLMQRWLWAFFCAAVWVALEMAVARLLTGFPWNMIGVSQNSVLPVIQVASVTGVYGVSFLVVWFSVSLVSSAIILVVRPQKYRLWLGDLMIPLLTLAVVCTYGVERILNAPPPRRVLNATLIQPSIPQTLIWDSSENKNRFEQLLRLSEKALETKPDLLVWPEAAVPNVLRYEPESFDAVKQLVKKHQVWLVLGADDAVPRASNGARPQFDFYNSAFLMSPGGELVEVYRKGKLVIFGEYVPLVRWLPFLKYLTPIGEGFSAGDGPVPFRIPDPDVSLSVLICFEDAFPHLARRYVNPETDFLLNLTNDGWFGESAAQWQHAANATFRAVENGLPLVRCGNNGLTCWIDPYGRMFNSGFPESDDVYGPGFKKVQVPLFEEGGKREPTFYNLHGDWFGWGCTALALSVGLSSFLGFRFGPQFRQSGSNSA